MTGDFHENEIDEYGWNNGVSDYPTLFDGTDMVCYEESIRPAVEQYTGNLMSYFYKQRNPGIKEKVISAIPSIEIRNGELMGCTTVVLKEPLADEEMEDLQDYLHGQFSDGWGEGFEQQEIQTDDGVLYVHFGEAEPFYFEVEQMQPAEPLKEQLPPHRPKMKLVGQDGNIFSILGRASRLLKENGRPDQAKEMCDRVYQSGNYYKALNIISEYVENGIYWRKLIRKSKNEKERGDAQVNQKYEITDIVHPQYPWLHRIRALRDVREDVHAGDLGGFVQSEENLSQEGQCWVANNAVAAEESYISGDAIMWDYSCARGCAVISGKSRIGGEAIIEDHAIVTSGYVHGNVHISGNAKIFAMLLPAGPHVIMEKASVYGELGGEMRCS